MASYKVIHPTGSRVLVLKDAPETESEGGIEIPDSATTAKFTGVIVANANGTSQKYTDQYAGTNVSDMYDVGTRVMFAPYVGIEINDKIGGKEGPYMLLEHKDILATVEQ